MKTRCRVALLAAAGAVLLTTACSETNLVLSPTPDVVHGNGIIVEESRDVSGCTRIIHGGVGHLYIRQGTQEELRVRAEENLIEYLKTEVRGAECLIWKDGVTLGNTAPIEYHLTVARLESVALTGAGWILGSDLDTDLLEVRLTGVGNIELVNLNAPRIEVDSSGVSDVILSGSVHEQMITLRGLGNYNGRDLTSAVADVLIAAGGSATVRVRDHLRATIQGSGNVFYIGDPIVDSSIGGSGDVVKIGG
jgi:hypothetical protein